jgi:hypothetical protein
MRRVTRASSPDQKQKLFDESFDFAPSPSYKPRANKRDAKASRKRDAKLPLIQTRSSRKKTESKPSLLSKLMETAAQSFNFVWSKFAYRSHSSVASHVKHSLRDEQSAVDIADDRTVVDTQYSPSPDKGGFSFSLFGRKSLATSFVAHDSDDGVETLNLID